MTRATGNTGRSCPACGAPQVPAGIRIDDLAGLAAGERIRILRERRGLTRPVLAGLAGMSASWLKGIERGQA